MEPIRIQRKRTKGWKMPENTVYVGRPTKWGNPFKIGDPGIDTPAHAVKAFREYITISPLAPGILEIVKELHSKNLACFCPIGQPCHADVLLEIANNLK